MTRRLRYAKDFYEDLERQYGRLSQVDLALAERAYDAVVKALQLLVDFPFVGRKVMAESPLIRELLIPFGASGYVVLYEIEDEDIITILAIRHQREDDYH